MRTFYRISDDLLIIEAIRRLRIRNALGGGRIAPEGTELAKLLQFLMNFGVFSPNELGERLAAMLQSGDLILTGRTSFREAGQRHSTLHSKQGVVGRLHPDAALAETQYFTKNGTPIISRRNKENGRLIYPGENVSYWRLVFDRIYVVSDGLPKSINLKRAAIDPY